MGAKVFCVCVVSVWMFNWGSAPAATLYLPLVSTVIRRKARHLWWCGEVRLKQTATTSLAYRSENCVQFYFCAFVPRSVYILYLPYSLSPSLTYIVPIYRVLRADELEVTPLTYIYFFTHLSIPASNTHLHTHTHTSCLHSSTTLLIE